MESLKKMNAVSYNDTHKSFFARFVDLKIGVIPLPLYVILAIVIYAASVYNKLPADMIGGFAVIMMMGVLLGDIGMRVPILKDIGGPAILSLMVPSILVFTQMMNPPIMEAVTNLMKKSNFLYLYISCLVAGSILGMNRKVLIQGFIRMLLPLTVGTLAAVIVGVSVGALFGYEGKHTLFFIIVPIIGGGIGEGILPLSLAYSEILHKPVEAFVSQLVPAAIIGNVVAIICAGFLKRLGERRPELSGNGTLVKSGVDGLDKESKSAPSALLQVNFSLMGAGLLLACSFFVFGNLAHDYVGIPGAIIMIFAAAIVKCMKLLPAQIEQGAFQLYKFVSTSLTWPLMVGLGLLYIPLKDVAAVISPGYVIICASVVFAMVISGYFVGKWINMYPVEAAIVTGCHSGLGGTGDVAILSASNRMELMPFAQIATRLGGASTIILASMLMKLLH